MSQSSMPAKRDKRNANFSNDEIHTLISAWSSVQAKFQAGIRHNIIFDEISQILNEMGFKRSADTLQIKISNLKGQYYACKKSLDSGSAPPTWAFWDQMHQVMSTNIASTKIQNNESQSDSTEEANKNLKDEKASKRNANFTNNEIHMLIAVWASENIQSKLQKGAQTSHGSIYEEMSRTLSQLGFQRSSEAIKIKIGNLKAQYFSHQKALKSDSSPPAWPFWDQMHQVLDKNVASGNTQSPDNPSQANNDLKDVKVVDLFPSMDKVKADTPDNSDYEDLTVTVDDPLDIFTVNSDASSSSSSNASSSRSKAPIETSVRIKEKRVGKRRKRRRDQDSFHLLLKQLVANDKRALELAEKRAKLDEQAMKRDDEMAAASISFFNAFTALAERSLQSGAAMTSFPSRLMPELNLGSVNMPQRVPEPSQGQSFVDLMTHDLEQNSSQTIHNRLISQTIQTRPPDMMNGRNEL